MKGEKKSRGGRILLFLMGVLLAMVVAFFAAYFSVSKFYSDYLDKKDAQEEEAQKKEVLAAAKENIKNMGFTMVYLDDPDTEKVEYCLLRFFNESTGEMSIFQIPTDAQVTLSDEVYQEVSDQAGQEVAKTLLLSDLGTYFYDRETKYQMIMLVIEDMLGGVKINSYEAMDYNTFVQVADLADPVMLELSQIVIFTDLQGEKHRLAPNTEYEIDGNMALGIMTYDDGFGSGDSGRMERTASYLKAFITSLTKNYTEEQMKEFLTSYYDMVISTGGTDDEDAYAKACLSIEKDTLSFYTMKGTQQEECYILDQEKIQDEIKEALGIIEYALLTDGDVDVAVKEAIAEDSDSADTQTDDNSVSNTTANKAETTTKEEDTTVEAQGTTAEAGTTTEATTEEEPDTVISSMDKTISIYNGAYINGLAGKWNRRLQAAGYDIEKVDNYEEATLDNGKIIVKEEGWGEDLQKEYFPNATIEVGTPEAGMDIQIILGKSEDF